MKFTEEKTPYTHFDRNNEFPVMAIFIKPDCVRFTHGKVYELRRCHLKQADCCTVIDDNGIVITIGKNKLSWKLVSDERNDKLEKIGL